MLPPSVLPHPLPAGMRDLLPEEARTRRLVARRALDAFALAGYALVVPPPFEFAEVLERGLGTLEPSEVLRFVEPESGEVAALRPDVTPQLARMIATRLADRPPPYRLAYEGTVLRRRTARARARRQIPQVGVELVGLAGPIGDLEVVELFATALRGTGLENFTLDLAESGIVRGLVTAAAPERRAAIMEALAQRDEEAAAEEAAAAGMDAGVVRALLRLGTAPDTLADARALLAGTDALPAVERLAALVEGARARGLDAHISVDWAEVRGFAYYTGTIFHAYAEGPGRSIGGGGRYDDLLGRFGAPMPAVGFALDLDAVVAALAARGALPAERVRALVVGGGPLVAELRGVGACAVPFDDDATADAYARAWGFTHVVRGERALELATGAHGPAASLVSASHGSAPEGVR